MTKLKRRQAIEPIIGHLKTDHGMGRCHFKGSIGDSIHAVLCAAGYNIRWLMRMILKHGIRRFLRLIFAGMVRANEGYFPFGEKKSEKTVL